MRWPASSSMHQARARARTPYPPPSPHTHTHTRRASVSTEPAMSLAVALIRPALLKPFLQESRRACQHETRPRREGDHAATLSSGGVCGEGGGGVGCSHFVVRYTPYPGCPCDFSCQAALMEATVLMLVHSLISCSRTVGLASADREKNHRVEY